jgi:WhiB family redox-sensing transcriptional regulator
MESVWAANKPFWRDDALCLTADPDLFTPDVETPEGLRKVWRSYCNNCPVRPQCLNSAIILNDAGYWGGTSTVQRRMMRRTRSRSKCPLCTSVNVVRVPHEGADEDTVWYEACVSCGASWKADSKPTPRQQDAEKNLHRPAAESPAPVPVATKRKLRSPRDTSVKTVPLTEAAASCL